MSACYGIEFVLGDPYNESLRIKAKFVMEYTQPSQNISEWIPVCKYTYTSVICSANFDLLSTY